MYITQPGMILNHVNVVAHRWNKVEFLFDLEVKRTLKIRLCGDVVSTLKSMLKLAFSNIEIRRCFNACWILTLFIIFKFLYCKYEYISLYQFDRLFCILFSAYIIYAHNNSYLTQLDIYDNMTPYQKLNSMYKFSSNEKCSFEKNSNDTPPLTHPGHFKGIINGKSSLILESVKSSIHVGEQRAIGSAIQKIYHIKISWTLHSCLLKSELWTKIFIKFTFMGRRW